MIQGVKEIKSVELHSVTKKFGTFTAINGIDINIPSGEFCTLLGPSGSGKTTLLKIIAGYEAPTEGLVKISGKNVNDVSVAKRNIGMVFQNYALFPHMTVASNIAFPLEMRRHPRSEIAERLDTTLKLVDLVNLGTRYPRELSGGQQQRVAVARALIFEPDILLMDEPLGALDKNLRQAMQFELKKLHQRLGLTIIYVTHDQEEALFLSDRIIVFDKGTVAQEASPEELYNAPISEFVANFLGECNLLPIKTLKDYDHPKIRLQTGVVITLNFPKPEKPLKTIGIRPEKIMLDQESKDCENQFNATILDVFFLGQGYKIKVYAEEIQWTIFAPNRLKLPEIRKGMGLKIGFNSEDLILMS